MKRFAKKAFTLVELLVVIAIIAILAVAGVVGYMAFTKKAEVNNDTSLVAELNSYVAAMSATDKINTPTDVRNVLKEDGIDLATLKLSADKQGYVPGFDIVAKKFVLIKDNALADGYTAAKNADVFAFAKTEAEANALKAAGFSLYLQSGYDKATIAIEGLGLDVGENTGITTINYTGASSANDVVIRT
ncbi:MAG: prepilin-type N-terminal cleavage/methylation domain-containing protein, partial [Clostridiales bacterium]|nr:prepilin-type N-terminal cleavage/methylation domain-containing protein [Clostridiales bacterium]